MLGINGFAATNDDNISLGDEMLNKVVDDFWGMFSGLNITEISADRKNLNDLPSQAMAEWSGFIRAHFDLFDLTVILSPSAVFKLLGRRSEFKRTDISLNSIKQALMAKQIDLKVKLKSIQMDIGEIKSLKEGDVILFSHSLSTPLVVSNENGEACFEAFLGQRHQKLAIELVQSKNF